MQFLRKRMSVSIGTTCTSHTQNILESLEFASCVVKARLSVARNPPASFWPFLELR